MSKQSKNNNFKITTRVIIIHVNDKKCLRSIRRIVIVQKKNTKKTGTYLLLKITNSYKTYPYCKHGFLINLKSYI